MSPDIDSRTVDVEEMLLRPGTYFNPQTEVVVIVDDSTSLDQGVFNMEAYEGAEWVRVSDEVPVDLRVGSERVDRDRPPDRSLAVRHDGVEARGCRRRDRFRMPDRRLVRP